MDKDYSTDQQSPEAESSSASPVIDVQKLASVPSKNAWLYFLIAAILIVLVAIIFGAHLGFFWLAAAIPLFAAKGFHSLKAYQRRAIAVIEARQPVPMSLTHIEKQFLWFNCLNGASGYKVNLGPVETNGDKFDSIKIDPGSKEAALKLKELSERNLDTPVAVEVYLSETNEPMALIIDGTLAWKAGWWADSGK